LSLIQDNRWDNEHILCIGASEAGHCKRAIHYRLMGTPKERYSTGQLAIFQRGIILEPLVAEIAEANGYNLTTPDNPYTKMLVVNDLPMRYMTTSLDYIFDGEIDFQIKCVNAWHFGHLKKSKDLLKDSPYYYWQVQAEMSISFLDAAIIYVCNVNDMSTCAIEVDRDYEAWRKKDEELSELWLEIVEGPTSIPNREYKQTDWNCKYCDYRNICWSEE
jgi:hypothetical protein